MFNLFVSKDTGRLLKKAIYFSFLLLVLASWNWVNNSSKVNLIFDGIYEDIKTTNQYQNKLKLDNSSEEHF